MKSKKVSIDLDIADLLGLKDNKQSLEYDIEFILENGISEYLKTQQEHEDKKKEFISLFKECFQEIITIIEKDPRQQIAVNCKGCRYGGRIDLSHQYGKCNK